VGYHLLEIWFGRRLLSLFLSSVFFCCVKFAGVYRMLYSLVLLGNVQTLDFYSNTMLNYYLI
jgi:hypothetical protein